MEGKKTTRKFGVLNSHKQINLVKNDFNFVNTNKHPINFS